MKNNTVWHPDRWKNGGEFVLHCTFWGCELLLQVSYTGWCILSHTAAIPCIVHQGNAPVYYLRVNLLIWNILTCTIKVMNVNKLGKVYDVMWTFIPSFVSIRWKILVNVLKQCWKYPELTCLIKNCKIAQKFLFF